MNIKKRFTNSETITDSLGKDSLFSGNRVEVRTESNGSKFFYINGINTKIRAISEGSTDEGIEDLSNTGLYGLYKQNTEELREVFQKNLELLNSKINTIHKELSYWDLYRIVSKVEKPSELESKFANLTPCQSLVISCESFTLEDEFYHMGDVIIKDVDGNAIKIDAVNSGIYYPSAFYKYYYIEENEEKPLYTKDAINFYKDPECTDIYSGTPLNYSYYKIKYSFTSNEPSDNENNPKQNYNYPIVNPELKDSFIYGIYKQASLEETIDEQVYTDNDNTISIKPLPKFFFVDQVNNIDVQEEIDVHHSIKKDNDTYIIKCESLPSGNQTNIQIK